MTYSTFTIRPLTVADYPRMVAMINSQETEGTSFEEMERRDRLRSAELPFIRLGAVNTDGEVVAQGHAAHDQWMPDGCFALRVRVDLASRHLGAGAEVYRALEDWALVQGATRLETQVKENQPEALAWAERRGWVKEHHLFESTLQLADWAPPADLLDAVRRAEASGIRFAHLADEVPEAETLRRHYDLLTEMVVDVPVFGERGMPPFEVWKQYVEADPHYDPHNVILAVDGEKWAAMAELNPMLSGGMYHGLTAVGRDYRGRGLSTAVKVVALEYARDKGVPYVRTNNHSANERMLAVNRKFGYVPAPGFYTVAKAIEK